MSSKEKALQIVKTLRSAGHQAYLAGGCVRDALLGKTPKDYDIATDALPEAVQKLFSQTLPVGSQFGVMMVVLEREAFAVSTFRYDGPYLDGRHPNHVRYGTLEEDILRRDFTINGMMYDPEGDRVIDLVEGRKDLERRIVRAIGAPEERFREDRLRMVRAARFAASLGFTIEEDTLRAVQRLAPGVAQIAWERIGEEITRMLTEGCARRGFEILDETGLLEVILPEITAMKGVEQTPDYHPEGDVFTHTMIALGHLKRPTETLAYGCLFHDVGKPDCFQKTGGKVTFYGHTEKGTEIAVEALKRLKRSRAVWERVAYLVKNHLRHTQAPKMRLSTLKRFLGEEGIDELLDLTRIDALSSNGDLSYYEFCRQKLSEFKQEEIHPPPLLGGKDLIGLGFTPGPIFQRILKDVEEAQLNGEIATREQAIERVSARYGKEVDEDHEKNGSS